jgi:hypothetical protein
MKTWLACVLAIAASGCPDIKTDPGEGPGELPTSDGPMVEFDPARSVETKARFIPFPNNLVRDPVTGKVNLSEQACETATAKATREGILNQLDGFGTYQVAMQVTFTEEVDEASLEGNISVYQRTAEGTANAPAAATPVPITVRKTTTLRFTEGNCTTPETVHAVAIIPLVPLQQQSTYVVTLHQGIKTAGGRDFLPSTTWALVRSAAPPVTLDANGNVVSNRTPLDPNDPADLARLRALDLLWKAHAQGLAFYDQTPSARPRSSIVVGFEFTTQTTTDPLDPNVAGSPAAELATTPLAGVQSVTCTFDQDTCPRGYSRAVAPFNECPGGESNTQCFLKIVLGEQACAGQCTTAAQIYGTGNQVCASVGCANVVDILAAGTVTTSYQQALPNAFDSTRPIPGPWTDPVDPEVQVTTAVLETLIFVPSNPAASNATVIFGHGLTSSKEALFAFGPQLATMGFASVAIDFVAHGSRAVRITDEATLGCGGSPSPSAAPQCFAPIFTSVLSTTRDNFRQSALDLMRLERALAACGTTDGCDAPNGATLRVNPDHILYVGQSMTGAMIGQLAVAGGGMKAAVLNVGGAGWFDVLENTDSVPLRCGLVDSLIDAGILMGDKWNLSSSDPEGLCATPAWKAQPGYAQFSAIARWVLDPADGANFGRKLATERVLIQQVMGDEVIPNIATERQGALFGLTAMTADPAGAPDDCTPYPQCLTTYAPVPSEAITATPASSRFVQYPTLPPDGGTNFPGNTFSHASLLRPANNNPDGRLATARMQVDAITFLFINQ